MTNTKPKDCFNCPVVRNEKDKIVCGVYKELKADKHSVYELKVMNKNCIIDWEK